jgi:cyclohexanone monooxygenase
VRGSDGRSIADTWEGSPRAYLGTSVAGFPNFFLLIGPNLGNGHSSAIVLIEAQLKYILDAMRTMRRRGAATVDVRREVQVAYNERVQAALATTVWNAGGCKSYYLDRNGTNSTIYPWTTIDLRRRTARFDAEDYVLGTGVPEAVAA